MRSIFLIIGPTVCALCCLGGCLSGPTVSGHGLDPRGLELWETAARYLMYSGLGLTLIGLVATQCPSPASPGPAGPCSLGALIFCDTVSWLALGGPRWLGAVTPLGGVLMVAGFLLFAWTAFRL